jgi:DNA-binding MarR family transcriptional regulator
MSAADVASNEITRRFHPKGRRGPREFTLLHKLASGINHAGFNEVSRSELGASIGCTARHVKRVVDQLVESGWLHIERRAGLVNRYYVLVEWVRKVLQAVALAAEPITAAAATAEPRERLDTIQEVEPLPSFLELFRRRRE